MGAKFYNAMFCKDVFKLCLGEITKFIIGDVGSTVTNCSCTLLTGHTEPKSVYRINSLPAGVLC